MAISEAKAPQVIEIREVDGSPTVITDGPSGAHGSDPAEVLRLFLHGEAPAGAPLGAEDLPASDEDPTAALATDDRCDGCRFWQPVWRLMGKDKAGSTRGQCRRYAPHPSPLTLLWGTTKADHWCGEFQPRDGGRRTPDGPPRGRA